MGTHHVENFGCRTSQADGDAISAQLEVLGSIPAGPHQANVVIVNTCTVTAEADRDARAFLRRVQRQNPQARIVVTGCYAQRAPEEVAAIPGVHAVVGNSHKHQAARIAAGLLTEPATASLIPSAALENSLPAAASRPFLLVDHFFAHSDFLLPGHPSASPEASPTVHRTRPSLKIQDGCGNRCTFCIIPTVRGGSRSMPAASVFAAVRQFANTGGQELVLSGINLGRWGRDLVPQYRFEDLLAEILEHTPLPRLRISSVEPMDWSEGIAALFSRWSSGPHPRLARHIHMPLQSGSDAVLRRMHRRYRPWHYAERLARLHAAVPQASFGADVMVGFPGETDGEFQESYDFIAAQPLTYLHLFPFSARPGTPGWELHQQSPVHGSAVRERMAALRALMEERSRDFRQQFLGATLSGVTLIPSQETGSFHRSVALSDNFLPIELDSTCPPNQRIAVRITSLTGSGMQGCRIESGAVDRLEAIA